MILVRPYVYVHGEMCCRKKYLNVDLKMMNSNHVVDEWADIFSIMGSGGC